MWSNTTYYISTIYILYALYSLFFSFTLYIAQSKTRNIYIKFPLYYITRQSLVLRHFRSILFAEFSSHRVFYGGTQRRKEHCHIE